jgi:hypothetical protein
MFLDEPVVPNFGFSPRWELGAKWVAGSSFETALARSSHAISALFRFATPLLAIAGLKVLYICCLSRDRRGQTTVAPKLFSHESISRERENSYEINRVLLGALFLAAPC